MISIAIEHADPGAAHRFADGMPFPTLVDASGALVRVFGFKVVPNGVLIDEAGVVRWAKFGGFSIDRPDDVATVERFLAGDDPGPSPAASEPYPLAAEERAKVADLVQRGHALLALGRRGDAVAEWREALGIDPGNFTIRKQIWAVEHPEKFYPTIDFAWQSVQLEAERAREIAEGICGPDGCPLPGRRADRADARGEAD